LLQAGDVVIDGGNSHLLIQKDAIRNYKIPVFILLVWEFRAAKMVQG
jgi:hypothetical protein